MLLSNEISVDFDARPLWNPEFTLSVSEDSKASVGIPLQKGITHTFKHIKPLSLYSTPWNGSSMNRWNLLGRLNGVDSIREICDTIIGEYPGVTEAEIVDRISGLYRYGFLI